MNLLVEQILIASGRHQFSICAYCFMPDHLHVLTEGESEHSDLIKLAHLLKQRTSFEYQRSGGGTLWQKGYFERALRNDEATWIVAKYILENPVRGGLVDEPLDYLFSGSLIYSRQQLLDLGHECGTP